MTRLIPLIAVLIPSMALALGADHSAGPVIGSQWPAGLKELVNVDNRVHGYFVNATDVFFFRGDPKALNAFLAKCAELPGSRLQVVLHAGKLEVKSPWDKSPREVTANWQLSAAPCGWSEHDKDKDDKTRPFLTHVDIWIGETLSLAELRIPANATVKSGGEIDAFIKQREDAGK